LKNGDIVKIIEGPNKGKIGSIEGKSGKTYIVRTNSGTYYVHEKHVKKA
jgi:ribosomal protein L24